MTWVLWGRRGSFTFDKTLNGFFSKWVPKKVTLKKFFSHLDFCHIFFYKMGVHSMYLNSVRGIFDKFPVWTSRQPQFWRRGQKRRVTLTLKSYQFQKFNLWFFCIQRCIMVQKVKKKKKKGVISIGKELQRFSRVKNGHFEWFLDSMTLSTPLTNAPTPKFFFFFLLFGP